MKFECTFPAYTTVKIRFQGYALFWFNISPQTCMDMNKNIDDFHNPSLKQSSMHPSAQSVCFRAYLTLLLKFS